MRRKILIAAAVVLAAFAVFNFDTVSGLFGIIGKALYPVFIGIIVALVINAPVKFIEKKFLRKLKGGLKVKRTISVVLTLFSFLGILVLIGFLTYPDIVRSVKELSDRLGGFDIEALNKIIADSTILSALGDNFKSIITEFAGKLSEILPEAVEFLTSTVSTVINVFLGLVFGVLIIMNKEKLVSQFYRVLRFKVSEINTKKTLAGIGLAGEKFSRFLSGQIVEAVIFGIAVYVTTLAFKIPYAALIALIMAVGNLIPMLGGYVSGAVAFVFILTASPDKALLFVIIIIVLQQIEQVTTYPLIVGRYVGIPAFWVLFSVVVFGGVFGFWGLVLGVPIVAFIDNFLKMLWSRRREEKGELPVSLSDDA